MVNPKVLDILRKYAVEPDPTVLRDIKVLPFSTNDQEELKNYGHELRMKFRTVLAELEHDASVLKMRNFDPDMLQLLIGIWRHLEKIFVTSRPEKPISTAHQIVQFLNDKHTKAVISNLIFLSDHHVKSTNVGFTPASFLKNPEIRGLKLLQQLKKTAENAPGSIAPTVAPATLQETWRPPSSTSMEAIEIPKLPPLVNITPIPPAPPLMPSTAPESPEAKKKQQQEAI